jgi:hypothetical protein
MNSVILDATRAGQRKRERGGDPRLFYSRLCLGGGARVWLRGGDRTTREAAVPRRGCGARKREHPTGGAWRSARERGSSVTVRKGPRVGRGPKHCLGQKVCLGLSFFSFFCSLLFLFYFSFLSKLFHNSSK